MKKTIKTLIFTLGLFGAPFSLAADDDYFRCLRDANERAITRWQLEHLQNLCGHKYPPLDILRESKRMLDESRKPENQVMGMCQSIVGGKPYGNPSLATKGRCEFLGNRWTPKNKADRKLDLKRRQDLAEQALKDFCAANPGDCADDEAAQKVCGSSSQGWRSGDAWSTCLQRERAKAKTRRLKK